MLTVRLIVIGFILKNILIIISYMTIPLCTNELLTHDLRNGYGVVVKGTPRRADYPLLPSLKEGGIGGNKCPVDI